MYKKNFLWSMKRNVIQRNICIIKSHFISFTQIEVSLILFKKYIALWLKLTTLIHPWNRQIITTDTNIRREAGPELHRLQTASCGRLEANNIVSLSPSHYLLALQLHDLYFNVYCCYEIILSELISCTITNDNYNFIRIQD